jgi:hypothetical protein
LNFVLSFHDQENSNRPFLAGKERDWPKSSAPSSAVCICDRDECVPGGCARAEFYGEEKGFAERVFREQETGTKHVWRAQIRFEDIFFKDVGEKREEGFAAAAWTKGTDDGPDFGNSDRVGKRWFLQRNA